MQGILAYHAYLAFFILPKRIQLVILGLQQPLVSIKLEFIRPCHELLFKPDQDGAWGRAQYCKRHPTLLVLLFLLLSSFSPLTNCK
jgi:hypothetical protein